MAGRRQIVADPLVWRTGRVLPRLHHSRAGIGVRVEADVVSLLVLVGEFRVLPRHSRGRLSDLCRDIGDCRLGTRLRRTAAARARRRDERGAHPKQRSHDDAPVDPPMHAFYKCNRRTPTTRPNVVFMAVSYTHLRAHETPEHLVCRLLLEKKNKKTKQE